MKYEIIGSVMPAAALQLEQGEAVYTDADVEAASENADVEEIAANEE